MIIGSLTKKIIPTKFVKRVLLNFLSMLLNLGFASANSETSLECTYHFMPKPQRPLTQPTKASTNENKSQVVFIFPSLQTAR